MTIRRPILHPSLSTPVHAADVFTSDEPILEVSIANETLAGLAVRHVNIAESMISKTDLSHVIIDRFDVLNCTFQSCDFTASKFPNSSWHVVLIDGARCSGTQLTNSTLKNVTFSNAKLELMNFRFSNLENIVFEDCVLDDVDFNNAKLKNVTFTNCSINNISFTNAQMTRVDLSASQIEGILGVNSLRGATMSHDQIIQLLPQFASEAGIKIV